MTLYSIHWRIHIDGKLPKIITLKEYAFFTQFMLDREKTCV